MNAISSQVLRGDRTNTSTKRTKPVVTARLFDLSINEANKTIIDPRPFSFMRYDKTGRPIQWPSYTDLQ